MNIIFDLDDTIYDLMEPFQRTHQERYAQFLRQQKEKGAVPEDQVDLDRLFYQWRAHSDDILPMEFEHKISGQEAFRMRIYRTYEDLHVKLTQQDAISFEESYRKYQKEIHVPQKMGELLSLCKEKGIVMGVLTNGRTALQQRKIDVLELTRWFPEEHIYISQALEYEKPDPRAFLKVQELMNLDPKETWYVGDNYGPDIVGAGSAGWHTIWFNHRRRNLQEEQARAGASIQPDFTANSTEEFCQWIKEL